MVILFGIVLAVPLLYFWLAGDHWFARVLAFLLLMAVFAVAGMVLSDLGPGPGDEWPGIIIGIGLAWPVSGIPTYIRRRRSASFKEPMSLTLR